MAVDILQVCDAANSHQSSQELALGLSILFSIYTLLAIMLSGATILLSSSLTDDGKTTKYKRVGELFVKDNRPAKTGASVGVPLVPLSR